MSRVAPFVSRRRVQDLGVAGTHDGWPRGAVWQDMLIHPVCPAHPRLLGTYDCRDIWPAIHSTVDEFALAGKTPNRPLAVGTDVHRGTWIKLLFPRGLRPRRERHEWLL